MAPARDSRKEMELWMYRHNILEAILVESMTKNRLRFPTIKEFILSELVNGTIDYIEGKSRQVEYQQFKLKSDIFERELYESFESQMIAHSRGKLNPKVRRALMKLCEDYYVHPTGPDSRPYLHTELYTHFKGFGGGGICPIVMESSFSFPYDAVIRVQKQVIPSLSAPERRDVEGIGRAMGKHIDNDLKFIGRKYHW
jgi:hypothetical protein